jgi:trigger factor
MATVTRENIGQLHDKITVTVSKEDYYPAFEKSVKQYSKNANIPGFRKGMVPAGMIRKMYGPSILNDEVFRTVEKELMGYLRSENPDIFANPLPMANTTPPDINNLVDLSFDFEIGLKPAFDMPQLGAAPFTFHKVKVTNEMINSEIERMRRKGGTMNDLETIANEEDVLNVLFTESDAAGNAVEEGISKDNSLLLRYFTEGIRSQLLGKAKGDNIVFQLGDAFGADMLGTILKDLGFDEDDAEAPNRYFRLDIEKIGALTLRELDEAFFAEIYPDQAIATEEEFRKKLEEDIQQYWNSQSRNQLHDQIYHFLLEETSMSFPEAFLKRWLREGGEKPKTEEEAEQEYPGFINSLKWTLLSDRIIRDNNIQVTPEEIREFIKGDVMRYFGQMQLGGDTSWLESYVDRMMKDEKQLEGTYRRLLTEKLFVLAESQVNPTEKEVTPEQLAELQHHHNH